MQACVPRGPDPRALPAAPRPNAIYSSGALTINNSRFIDNAALATNYGWGGAIYLSAGADVTIHTVRPTGACSGG